MAEQAEGARRRAELLDTIAARVASGMIGETVGGELGLLERASPPFGVAEGRRRRSASAWRRTSRIRGDAEDDDTGDRQWQISF